MRLSLQNVGKMTVEVVSDPYQAIGVMTRFKPDLVMLDWMMPGMDGPELFLKMKQEPQVAALPVVFITAKAGQAPSPACLCSRPGATTGAVAQSGAGSPPL